MATIFIVKHATGGYYTTASSYYHHTEEEARLAFEDAKDSVGEDPAYIELVRLDTETLEAITHDWWEGSVADLENEGGEECEDGDDDWICEGKPDGE
jgi:hypothetical protein